MNRARFASVLAGTAILLNGWVLTTTASERPAAPPRPPWIKADGTVDRTKLPDRMPVMGPDGKPAEDASGRQITVDVRPPGRPTGQQNKNDPSGSNRRVEKGENGAVNEIFEVKPSSPPAGTPARRAPSERSFGALTP